MGSVIVLRGISGAGKSTYTQKFHPNAVVASADTFFVRDGRYEFDPKQLGTAHKYSFVTFTDALNRRVEEVVVDNTNTKLWEFEKYIKLAQERGYEVKVVRLVVDAEVASARNQHGVPSQKVREMFNRFEDFPGEIIVNNN